MRTILHILTKPSDHLVEEMIAQQRRDSENQIEIADLTQPAPDYSVLLEKIFAAESVAVW